MNGGEPSVWSVVSVSAPDLARTERGPAAVQHAEWVRLFLGRALAPARLVGQEHAPSAVEYLISGIEVSGSLHRDDAACIEAASAVATDFEGLRDVIAYHRDRIERCAQDPNNVPLELFLTTYPMLMCVTVSDDPADWRVTDQGLCIVRWGLRGPRHRPLLQWSAQELQALQRRVIAASGMPDVAPGEASYSRVARSAWKVIKDDDEQQRVQKVGDRAKGTGGESKAASGKPAEANPSPVAARAAWMAWLETGLLVLALAGVGVGWFWDHQRLSATNAKLKSDADAEPTLVNGLQQRLKNSEDAVAAEQGRTKSAEQANKYLDERLKHIELHARTAWADSRRLQLQVSLLQMQLAKLRASGETAGPAVSTSNAGPSPGVVKMDTKPAAAEAAKPNDRRKDDGGPAEGDGKKRPEPLAQFAELYKNPPTVSQLAAGSNEVAEALNRLNDEAGFAAQERLDDSYVRRVTAISMGADHVQSPIEIDQAVTDITSKLFRVLRAQNNNFQADNALIRLGDAPSSRKPGTTLRQRWYWVQPGIPFAKFEKAMSNQALTADDSHGAWFVKVYLPGLTRFKGIDGLQHEDLYRWRPDGQSFDEPLTVDVPFEISSRSADIQSFANAISAFAKRVVLEVTPDIGQKEAKDVRIPAAVAWQCARDIVREFLTLEALSNPAVNGFADTLKLRCSQLLNALEPQEGNGVQPDLRARMSDFKKCVVNPSFFPADLRLSTLRIVGALSVSAGKATIIAPLDGGSKYLAGQLAVLDRGLGLRQMGYLEDGKPVFDAPADLENLRGCAVFVVESNPQQPPSK